ncbi:Tyr recombinase domain-containing protein [Plasmodiophora brassicae]
MRKTGSLLGTWGGASDIDLQHAFRHSSMAMTSQYKADSSALLEHAKNQPDDAMIRLAPRWRPIYVENLQINMNARQVDDDVVSLANGSYSFY